MKRLNVLALLLLALLQFSYAQDYHVQLNAGNYEEVISSCYDKENNELITLDKAGFVVIWNAESFAILNKFQLPPANLYASAKPNIFSKPEIRCFKNVITLTYPNYVNILTEKEELVDMFERKTGAFRMQSKIGRHTRYQPLKVGGLIGVVANTRQSGNYNFIANANIVRATDSGTIAASAKLNDPFTFLAADESEKTIAIGYEKGKLEIRDALTLQTKWQFSDYGTDYLSGKVCEVAFFPNQQWVAYNTFNSNKIIIRNYADGSLVDSFRIADEATTGNFDLDVSPSGKFLCITTKVIGQLFMYDVAAKKYKLIKVNLFSSLSNVFFKNDNILIATGISRIPSNLAVTTNTGKTGAYIGLIDWKNETSTPNLNISPASEWISSYGSSISKPSPLETVLHNYTGNYAFLQPQSFQTNIGSVNSFDTEEAFINFWNSEPANKNDLLFSFGTEVLQRPAGNSAMDFMNPNIVSILYHKGSSFSNNGNDTFFTTSYNLASRNFLRANLLKIHPDSIQYANNYQLIGSIYSKGLSIFSNIAKDASGKRFDRIIIFDDKGKKVWEDALFDGYSPINKLAVSPDAQFLAYQNGAEKIIVLSLKNYTVHKIIATGFKTTFGREVTGFGYSSFTKGNPSTLIHQVYKTNEQGNQIFCLLKTDILKSTSDTLCSFPLQPLAYDVDSGAKKIYMLYNYNFMDSLWSNNEKITSLIEENFKAAYQPSLLVYDVGKKDFVQSIQTGNIGLQDIAVCGNWVSLVQTDGQLRYINMQQPAAAITHAISDNNQALVMDKCYYASKEFVPYIQLNKNGQSYAATQVDILLNKPHAIIETFAADADSLAKPFKLAYNKRLQQQNIGSESIDQLLAASNDVQLKTKSQQNFYTESHKISIPVEIVGNSKLIKKVSISINNFPVSGRKGLDASKIIKDKKIDLVLNDQENYITVNAEKIDGSQLPPLRYYYYCKTDTAAKQQLYFFSVGVSNYKDTIYNLKYAAKDANDILQTVKHSSYGKAIVHSLTNENGTVKNITSWKSILEKTTEKDVVIFYFAGHGLLGNQYNFYYATHETDFSNPERKSLSYNAILDLLEISPSRKKILLLDACHSGSFDRSLPKKDFNSSSLKKDSVNISSNEVARSTIKPRGTNVSERQAFLFMNELFTDYSNDVGVDVIAASLGNSYALEKQELQNGLFTYSLIRAIALGYASNKGQPNDGSSLISSYGVTLPEVKAYLDKEVRRLSNGAQVPNIRSNTIYSKDIFFGAASFVDVIADNEYQTFLKKYQ